jgi:hypothetical protein
MSDGYVVVRSSTIAWLLEAARLEGATADVPVDVAIDLGKAVTKIAAPEVAEDRLRSLGPLLSIEEHEVLLGADEELDLPTHKHDGAFWRLVAGVVHAMLRNEAEAVLRVISDRG